MASKFAKCVKVWVYYACVCHCHWVSMSTRVNPAKAVYNGAKVAG